MGPLICINFNVEQTSEVLGISRDELSYTVEFAVPFCNASWKKIDEYDLHIAIHVDKEMCVKPSSFTLHKELWEF